MRVFGMNQPNRIYLKLNSNSVHHVTSMLKPLSGQRYKSLVCLYWLIKNHGLEWQNGVRLRLGGDTNDLGVETAFDPGQLYLSGSGASQVA